MGGLRARYPSAFLVALLLGGCASDRMVPVATPAAVVTPAADRATVVFTRPGVLGFAIQSSVFDVSAGKPLLIGIVSSQKKLAYVSSPGQRRFMVIGETAEFLDADLSPGRIYYVRVTLHMGMWKARFSLDPVSRQDAKLKLAGDLSDTDWTENTPASVEWAHGNMHSIEEKMAEALPKWEAGSDRPKLNADDGL